MSKTKTDKIIELVSALIVVNFMLVPLISDFISGMYTPLHVYLRLPGMSENAVQMVGSVWLIAYSLRILYKKRNKKLAMNDVMPERGNI